MNKTIFDALTELQANASVGGSTTSSTKINLLMTPTFGPNKPFSDFQCRLVVYGLALSGSPVNPVMNVVVGDDASFTHSAIAATFPITALSGKFEKVIDFRGAAQSLTTAYPIAYVRLDTIIVGGAAIFGAYLTKFDG